MLVTSIPQYVQGLLNVKIDLTTTDQETLYTVPSDADFNATVVHSILAANTSGSSSTVKVDIVGDGLNGSGAVTNHEFAFGGPFTINANSTIELLAKDLILNAGEIVKVTAGHADRMHVILSIQELSKTRVTTSAISRI